jgi:putative nucleotidyltransferase with HDIG domain
MKGMARRLDSVVRVLQRFGVGQWALTRRDQRRILALVCTSLAVALLLVDFDGGSDGSVQEGEIAPHTVTATHTFEYVDEASLEAAREEASTSVEPVFVHRLSHAADLTSRVSRAFRRARAELGNGGVAPEEAARASARQAFTDGLGVGMPDVVVRVLEEDGFRQEAEVVVTELLMGAMRQHVIPSEDLLPKGAVTVGLFELTPDGEPHDLGTVNTRLFVNPREARESVSIAMLEYSGRAVSERVTEASSHVAKALVRPNVTYDVAQTNGRRESARQAVTMPSVVLEKGQTLYRDGDRITDAHVLAYRAMNEGSQHYSVLAQVLVLSMLIGLLLGVLYSFCRSMSSDMQTHPHDAAAVGLALIGTAAAARILVAGAGGIASFIGFEAEASSVWFLLPVAGVAMLIRLILGPIWTLLYTVSAAVLCSVLMGLGAIPMIFFLFSGLLGARLAGEARERIAVFRAALWVGFFHGLLLILFHFVQIFAGDEAVSLATQMRPLWSMSLGFVGGVFSSFVVLGLLPMFEVAGFVTDYRMLELANLNHPLLRQLMLRAPGTYHHSLVVGTLAEAGCEAVGANGVRARVAAYFHDIGKTLNPQYFVENQRDGRNRHEGLDPTTSARVIIAHVADGFKMAQEHRLPQPILDIIQTHHGTGLLQFFYVKAHEGVEEGAAPPDENAFRYAGPKPDTREAGIVMLADKVEAATRTIKHPTERNLRQMMGHIIESVIQDGQFTNCPMTLDEIDRVKNTFVTVLMGIYHQRIEYPSSAKLDEVLPRPASPEVTITLDQEEGLGEIGPTDDATEDYESIQFLPRN